MSERMAYLKGLMSEVPRKNSWQLAEEAGEATPDGMQRLLSTAVWDVEGVRDDLRDYVLATLGSAEGCWCSMKVFFEEGKPFGWGQAAVQRYSRSGRELSDWGFLGYASEKEQALIDRALYLPQEWTADEERRREAKVPADKTFATKPELGRQMLERAFAAGVPAQWVTGDSVYGGDRRLRLWLEEQRRWFVLGIGKDEPLWSGFYQQPADERASVLPKTAWQRLSCGTGAKGPRVYDWVLLPLPRCWREDSFKG